MTRQMPSRKARDAASITSFAEALATCLPRPDDRADRTAKKNYAELFSNAIAVWLAHELRSTGDFDGIQPRPDGTGRESQVASGRDKKLKKTDVRYGTLETGLELLVSIKTLSFRDASASKNGEIKLGRYTKNMVRNDHELRAEAMDLHERHPYSVLVAIVFLPFAACTDGLKSKDPISSFGHAILTFRPRAGRKRHSDPAELFEKVFIGLYDPEGEDKDAYFFNVEDRPPRNARPPRRGERSDAPGSGLMTIRDLVGEIRKEYGIRNRKYIEWADPEVGDAIQMARLPPEEEAAAAEDDEMEVDAGS